FNPEEVKELHYSVSIGAFKVAEAIAFTIDTSGTCVCRLNARIKSTGIGRLFRNVNYHFGSCLDVHTGLPLMAFRYLKTGKNVTYYETSYDRSSRIDSTIAYSDSTGRHVLDQNIYDLVSAYLYFWQHFHPDLMQEGEKTIIPTFFYYEPFDLVFTYRGKEEIKTKNGTLICHKVVLRTEIGPFFKTNEDMIIWFSDDEKYLPVKAYLNLRNGSLKGELLNY
ncbi:MAG: DUF3108 domain-containing protein, partial [Bacteroidota bacterium]|nr:DUF3108 domain-containing protein [Bacteroidota bacterium]